VGAYLHHVGNIPVDRKGSLPMANTLAHHAQAASRFLRQVMEAPFSIYESGTSKPTYVPFIGDRISQRRKWQKPRDKREPYTFAMLHTFFKQVSQSEKEDSRSFLGKDALIFNSQCLGIFTGSRVSEYAQSKGKVTDVSRVPTNPSNPSAPPLPLAFVASDFLFLSASGVVVPHHDIYTNPALATQLQVTFRHDKSGRNHSIRKFGPGRRWLCPIKAAARILYRAHILGSGPSQPICVYRASGSQGFCYLRDSDVTDKMRRICVSTYPDPQHFLRLHITRFASHSNRVTAAVALHQGGLSIDDIAHRLRWQPQSVAFYLRETSTDIGDYTSRAILGAQQNS
jgi:hypothetical protein